MQLVLTKHMFGEGLNLVEGHNRNPMLLVLSTDNLKIKILIGNLFFPYAVDFLVYSSFLIYTNLMVSRLSSLSSKGLSCLRLFVHSGS